MSRETLTSLNSNTLIGMTAARGSAWHYRRELQGNEPNHYPGPIPVADVARRLFHWRPARRRVAVEIPADFATMTHFDDDGRPMRWAVQQDRFVGIARDDTHAVIDVHGSKYEAHDYEAALLRTVSTIVGDTLVIGSAGVLGGGAQAWVSVEVPETITTPEGVAFRPNLLACSSLDASIKTTYKRVVTNVVCDNTMGAALTEQGQEIKVPHLRGARLDVLEARQALVMVHATAEAFQADVAELCGRPVSDRQWQAIVADLAPLTHPDGTTKGKRGQTLARTKREQLNQLWQADHRVQPWARTAWGVLQATNTWNTHYRGVKGASRVDRNMTKVVDGQTQREDLATVDLLRRLEILPAARGAQRDRQVAL